MQFWIFGAPLPNGQLKQACLCGSSSEAQLTILRTWGRTSELHPDLEQSQQLGERKSFDNEGKNMVLYKVQS